MPIREISRVEGNRFQIDLPSQVRQILSDMEEMALAHVAAESPVAKRIFPSAYRNSPEMEMDFQKMTREALGEHHRSNLETFKNSLYNSEITFDEALAWVGALNSMRLILGTALDVQEDQDPPDEEDPDYQGYVIYDLLTYLQGAVIDALQD